MRILCSLALMSALTVAAGAAEGLNAPTGQKRDRDICTRIISGSIFYQRPDGGLNERAEPAIQNCMKGEQFELPLNVDPRGPASRKSR